MVYKNGALTKIEMSDGSFIDISDHYLDEKFMAYEVYLSGYNRRGTDTTYMDYYNTTYAFKPINNKIMHEDKIIYKSYSIGEVSSDTLIVTVKDTLDYIFKTFTTLDGKEYKIDYFSKDNPDTVYSHSSYSQLGKLIYKDSLLLSHTQYNLRTKETDEETLLLNAFDTTANWEMIDSLAYDDKGQVIFFGIS